MSFIGPKNLTSINAHLREVFSSHRTCPSGNCSITLVSDLSQLPLVKYIPMYVGALHGNILWRSFTTFVTLSIVFRQQGDNPVQVAFRSLLLNLRNATPTIADWNLLMSRKYSSLSQHENHTFEHSTHLLSTKNYATFHNK